MVCEPAPKTDQRLLTVTVDELCDGWFELCTTFIYDAKGERIGYEQDQACNGMGDDWDNCASATRDNLGNQTEHIDVFCDGKRRSDICTTWTYDTNGTLTDWKVDHDCDGELDHCHTFTYDADHHKTSTSRDWGCDGTPEACDIFTHYANGQQISGQPNEICDTLETYACGKSTYDAEGKETSYDWDFGCDGLVGLDDHCGTSTYDTRGNLLKTEVDVACNGSVDSCLTYTYETYIVH